MAHGSTSLATVNITRGYWRAGKNATTMYLCSAEGRADGTCVGGTNSGLDGSGYCLKGLIGPRCQICDTPGTYLSISTGQCEECPLLEDRLMLPLQVVGMLFTAGLAVHVLGKRVQTHARKLLRPSQIQWLQELRAFVTRVKARVQQLELAPRLKLLFTFYELASTLTVVYGVELNAENRKLYEDSVAVFSWFTLNVDQYLIPGQCAISGFQARLVLRALPPLVLIAAIPIGCMLLFFMRSLWVRLTSTADNNYSDAASNEDLPPAPATAPAAAPPHQRWNRSLHRFAKPAIAMSLPLSLSASFCLCPGVSRGIFASWDCESFELDVAGNKRSFLREDLTIICSDSTGSSDLSRFGALVQLAVVFLLCWPIGMPLLYLLVLVPNRTALQQRRRTQMVRATEFLHKEYAPMYFWWEVLPLLQRLALTGWVMLIPVEQDEWRILVGLLVTVAYLTLLQFVQPCAQLV